MVHLETEQREHEAVERVKKLGGKLKGSIAKKSREVPRVGPGGAMGGSAFLMHQLVYVGFNSCSPSFSLLRHPGTCLSLSGVLWISLRYSTVTSCHFFLRFRSRGLQFAGPSDPRYRTDGRHEQNGHLPRSRVWTRSEPRHSASWEPFCFSGLFQHEELGT